MKQKPKSKKKIPYQYKPEGLDLRTWQIMLRKQVAREERFSVSAVDENLAPGEYVVSGVKSMDTYKVVYRGAKSPWNYCSCMDFKTSQLGTCKHLEAVKGWFCGRHHVRREIPPYSSVYVDYSSYRRVRIRIGVDNKEEFEALADRYFDAEHALLDSAYDNFDTFLRQAREISDTFRCYNDALQLVLERREMKRRAKWIDKLTNEDFANLLRTKLYPYQVEGIRFATRTGRAIIADEMGLGKTVQAIGVAELLRKHGLIGSTLIVCPTSLKYQWKREIETFTGQQVCVIEGGHLKRREQYSAPEPYKIVSYNAVCNDVKILGGLETDLVVIDEVQRLKNWNTQIARAARKIHSSYAVILSGTPLENRLEELFSVVEFVDQFLLGPYYLFRDRYIITDDKGATIGYRNLNEIGRRLQGVLIRRKKKDVHLQMPERQDKNLMVPMTKEQRDIHDEAKASVSRILKKWETYHFLSETDRNRLILFLQQMRMVCDSTYILDQKSRYDTKVDEAMSIISDIVESGEEKVVIFSQWERMTRLLAREMDKRKIGYEYLHGGIPSKARKDLVNNFTDLPECRVFLSTDAGSTGLNLQVASVIINIDLPWNPAVLEQRIARIYRIGQKRNIQVINLVAANTFEESMLDKLRFKSNLFAGVLDNGEDTVFADSSKFERMMDDLSQTVTETTDNNSADDSIIDVADQERSEAAEKVKDTTDRKDVTLDNPHMSTHDDANQVPSQSTTDRRKMIERGVAFLSGLTETLRSKENTARLVDSITEEDEETGQVSLRIPVADKKTVAEMLGLIGRLFDSFEKGNVGQ